MEALDISVVLVLQDRAATVPTVLAHLEQQTLPAAQFEIVAVDNGSADNTLAVLERYAAGAPVRIQVVDAGRGNFPKSRNFGIERARGKWIIFLDQDVLASPNLLERYAREFTAGPAFTCLLGPVAPHPQLPANALTRRHLPEEIRAPADPERLAPMDWHGYNLGVARTLLRDLGGFDESFSEPHFIEAAFAHRLAQSGIIGRVVPKAYAYEWRAAAFDAERARCYARGYALYQLEARIGEPAREALAADAGGLRWRMHELAMPFYVRACRDAEGDVRYAGALYRRVLRHDLYRGYTDARRGRAPRV